MVLVDAGVHLNQPWRGWSEPAWVNSRSVCSDGRPMTNRLCLTRRTAVFIHGDGQPMSFRVGDGVTSAEATLAGTAPGRVRVVLGPPDVQSRVGAELAWSVSADHVHAIDDLGEGTLYEASYLLSRVRDLIEACTANHSVIESVSTADYAWAEAASVASAGPDTFVAVALPEASELRLIAIHERRPLRWRRLPLESNETRIASVLQEMWEHSPGARGERHVLTLGDEEVRCRVADAAHAIGWTVAAPSPRIAELNCEPLAVAAAFGGTGPRFVPPEVVARERTRTRRRGILAALAAILVIGLAGTIDALDLRSEIDTTRAARREFTAEVSDAMAIGDAAANLAETVAALETLREATPRWTAVFDALAVGLPRSATIRGLAARGDSVQLEVEGPDVAVAVEALTVIPVWTGLEAVSSVETEIGADGGIAERLTLAARVTWGPLNGAEERRR